MKFVDTKVVFREVPDEITLAINISNCPVHCPGCHSSYLAQDIGETLSEESLGQLIADNPGITCVSFMGGDSDPAGIGRLARWIKDNHPGLKTCWYSGRNLENARDNLYTLDYIKVGPYIEALGPLDSQNTNQRFYRIDHNSEKKADLLDITSIFTRHI